MSADFQTLWGEVLQTFPNLSPFLAKRFVQRAVTDIYNSHQWSFLAAEGVLFSPGIITTGSFNITQFSNTIIADAAAILALDGLTNPILTKRQVRFSIELYNIISVDVNFAVNGILTLDRPVKEISNISQSYQVYRCYYGPPQDGVNGTEVTDFLRYNSIYNPAIASYFLGDLPGSRDLLNRLDPMRTNMGNNPYYLFAYKAASDGTPQFEMWPHPTMEGVFLCSYQRQGLVPSAPTDVLPLIIPDDLVLEKSLYYGCLWAMKNQSRYEELKGVNWMLLAKEHKIAYSNFSSAMPGILEQTQVRDEEVFPSDMVIEDRTFNTQVVGDDDRTGWFSINPNP